MLKSTHSYWSSLLLLIATSAAAVPAKIAYQDRRDGGINPFNPGCLFVFPGLDICDGSYVGPIGDYCESDDLLIEQWVAYSGSGEDAGGNCVKGADGGPAPGPVSCFAACLAIGFRAGGSCQTDQGLCIPGNANTRVDSAHCACDSSLN